MMTPYILLLFIALPSHSWTSSYRPSKRAVSSRSSATSLLSSKNKGGNGNKNIIADANNKLTTHIQMLSSSLLSVCLLTSCVVPPTTFSVPPASASDGAAIAACLFKKCPGYLAKCIANPMCLGNVICINTCNGKADETGCQIKCGDIFENDVIGEFNKCAVSDMSCVPQKADDGSYKAIPRSDTVQKFDTSLFTGKWYITAGQNKLFDTFPCQVHFFESTGKDSFVGQLNWNILEPDGEQFSRNAVQVCACVLRGLFKVMLIFAAVNDHTVRANHAAFLPRFACSLELRTVQRSAWTPDEPRQRVPPLPGRLVYN